MSKSDHQVTVLTGTFEVIDAIAAGWRELCDEGSNGEPFYRPEFVRAYMRAFEPNKTLALVIAKEGQRLDAVLPLVSGATLLCGLPVKRLRGAANVHSCHFDLVRRAGPSGEQAIRAMWRFLKELSGWDVLELPRVPAGAAIEQLVAEARCDGFSTKARPAGCGPYIDLTSFHGCPEGWLASVGSGLRRAIQRGQRVLKKQGDLQCRRIEAADDFLPTFQALEGAGWKGKNATAIESSRDTQGFYSDISQAAGEFHYLCCHLLEVNHQIVAGSFGLGYKGRFFGLKITYDEAFRACSPGHVLVHSMLQDCAERQFSEFDFLPPWSEWKGRWTRVSREQTNWYIFRNSLYGHLLDRVKFTFVPAVKSLVGERRADNLMVDETLG